MMKRLLLTLALLVAVTVPAAAQPYGPNQTITVVDSGTACVTAPTACATYALDSVTPAVTFSISGTWTGTLTFEGTNNDATWTSVLVANLATAASATTTTASGLFGLTNSGFLKLRVRATAAITGSALVTLARGNGIVTGPGGNVASTGQFLAADGTAIAPSYAFTSEPTLGFRRSVAGNVTLQGAFSATAAIAAGTQISLGGGNGIVFNPALGILFTPAAANFALTNNAVTIGSVLKVDALPTIASGFGTSPAVTAGSTPFAGSVAVGTGGVATTGTITFGGTAFPTAPFCVVTATSGAAVLNAGTSTTQLLITGSVAFAASSTIYWICVSPK